MSLESLPKKGLTLSSLLPQEKKIIPKEKVKPKKVLMLAGPTACGKTALSLMLADLIPAEIVSADSCQVYRGMDIGTAKASQEEREAVAHHLIDVRHIQEPFNVVDYYYAAKQACESILARDKTPIIVGGSGFYFRALLYGPPSGPPSIAEVRQPIEAEMERMGPAAFYERLQEIDPEYAKTLTKNDKQKMVRAFEIISLSGKKVSDQKWKRDKVLSDYAYHCWFLHRPRDVLYNRINDRCDEMLKLGLLDEVKELEKQGIRHNRTVADAIGYRQALEYLQTEQSEGDYQAFVEKFKMASRRLAKRQFTWFKKEPLFNWLNIEVHDLEIAADMILQEFFATS